MPSESKGLYHDIYATGLTRITRMHAINPHARLRTVFIPPAVRRPVITQSGVVGVWKMRHTVLKSSCS